MALKQDFTGKANATESDSRLSLSILTCLGYLIDGLPSESRYLQHVPWLAIAILQLSHAPLFEAGVQLLSNSLKRLETDPQVQQRGLSRFLQSTRPSLGAATQLLDAERGVFFADQNIFFVGLSVIVFYGLKYESLHGSTRELLTYLLRVGSREYQRDQKSDIIPEQLLGLIVCLLMGSTEHCMAPLGILKLCNITVSESSHTMDLADLLVHCPVRDKDIALLLAQLCFVLLENFTSEREHVVLYHLLEHIGSAQPNICVMM